MQIKQLLFINVAFLAIAGLVVSFVILLTQARVRGAEEQSDIANEIADSAFERSVFRTDYQRTGNEVSRAQWFAKSEEIRELIKTASDKFRHAEERELVTALSRSNETTIKLFSLLVENRQRTASGRDALSRETEAGLIRLLNEQLHDYRLNAGMLRETADGHLSTAMRLASRAILGVIAFVTVAATIFAWQLGRTIRSRIAKLSRGAAAIGEGNLEHRIELEDADEFSGLAEAFNAMSEKLRLSYRRQRSEIAEREQAEEAMRRSEERFRKVFEEGPLGMQLIGLDYRFSKVNSTFSRLVGYTEEELQALTPFDITHPDDIGKDKELASGLLEERLPHFSIEKRYIRKDGRPVWVSLTASIMLSDDGKPLSFLGMVEDITDRKRAEEALRTSEERLRKSEEIAGLGSWELDVAENILTWSDEVYRIFGLQPREFGATYEAFLEAVHPDDREAVDKAYSGSLEEGRDSYEIEHRVVRKSTGEIRYVHEKCEHYRDETGRIVRSVGMVHDITERKLAEQERERLLQEVQRSNKELEQFAYVASHDLQEPLRTVENYLQLLERKYKGRLDDKADKYIHFAVDAVQRMWKLIEGLLAYSRISRKGEEFKPVDLNDVFSTALSNLSVSIRESHAEISKDELPVVPGDATQLVQLFQNLLGNAIKYRKPDRGPRVRVSVKKAGIEHLFSVQDNGIGIDPKDHDKVFQIFRRLHSRTEYPGTGIGLALCKRVVERHHGHIWVESVPGEGSTFFFTLPA